MGGDPFPQVLWSKENGHIPVGRAEILEEDRSLVIRNATPDDRGQYICEAHNSVGQISGRANLAVNSEYLGRRLGLWAAVTTVGPSFSETQTHFVNLPCSNI